MIKKQFGIGMLILVILLVGITLIPAVSAQEENYYNVTVEEAFEHANANMIDFIAADALGFENWTGALIGPKPLELYDINGQKLFYQFSVYKNDNLIGTIDVCANKTLGPSINDIVFDPKPYKTTEAMEKSKEIAKSRYPTGEIESTVMVVYSYPRVGAMTLVNDKTAGDEHRIFVDGYTLDEVQDKPVTEKELGVWSVYDQTLKYGKENNLKEWQKSDQFAKSIEKAAANKAININVAVTEKNMEKLSGDAAITTITKGNIDVPVIKQQTNYYCVPTSIQMLCKYFKNPNPAPSQDSIFKYLKGKPKIGLSDDDISKWVKNKWGKTPVIRKTSLTNLDVVTEIDKKRPFFSLISGHCRVCRGYLNQGGYFYLYINDPLPGTKGYERTYGSKEIERVYVR
ncbi:C39 family peptidase [Methanosarcina sp.]|jgi:hypothetical protein|uniref:C39 family peptidase n=1 Tax=Methanosarcina sp. TaxID=2213 RepID=UPI00298848F0|nr:C39 family peptidase [Methanosarcina sp.]MDW5549660.1 C39 family peptidase [Methanosarcina sp.]MDW5552939.1 C39 family peptidase [Methanosarcina sp.]MDW5558047.1 C39 family peptidase [Methanosarcina sp.]